MLREARHTKAEGQGRQLRLELLAQLTPQMLGHQERFMAIAAGKQQRELVAADSSDRVELAPALSQDACEASQSDVPLLARRGHCVL